MSFEQANNYLAVNLYRLLAEEKGNVFFSSLSISTAMAMLLCAAEGETESEMKTALGHDHAGLNKSDIASAFEKQMSVLLWNPASHTLSCANSLLSQKCFDDKEGYKKVLTESLKAVVLEEDFLTESEKVVNQINKWVEEKTKNIIPKHMESLDPKTVIVLLNAVYFKGRWLQKFRKEATLPQNFYNGGVEGNTKEIDMMHMTRSFPLYEDDVLQALQLPYIGEEISMLVLLPRAKDGIESVESNLTPSFVQDLKKKLWKSKVSVSLPRFRLEYTKSLVSCFKRLGIERAFSRGAELSIAGDSENLAVSEILHKAVLEVNEEGSEAAAATMVAVQSNSFPEFIADHPFVFVIYDSINDLVLFMGRVNEL